MTTNARPELVTPDASNSEVHGYPMASGQGVAKTFLEPADTFDGQLLRSGLPREEAELWASIWRKGLAYRVPSMVLHAQHALIAAEGEGGEAKYLALGAVTGQIPQTSGGTLKRARNVFRTIKRAVKGKGTSNDTVQAA